MRVLAGIAGVFVVIVTSWSLLRTLVVPRGSSRLNSAKNRVLYGFFRFVARHTGSYLGRDRVLMWSSPLAIFTSLLMWLTLFFVGYSLLIFASSDLTLAVSAREAGSSLFTLGYATNDRANLTALDFLAASTGPITIGLLIGYLPTLYGAYQQREAEVTLLLARAGEPNWGPELLARHSQVGTLERLQDLWPVWERWAAEISESPGLPELADRLAVRDGRGRDADVAQPEPAAGHRAADDPAGGPVPARAGDGRGDRLR
jgi:hypothetical protein